MLPLKIWTDFSLERFSSGGCVEMLIPFRGQSVLEQDRRENILAGRYDKFEREGHKYLELAPLEEADVAVFPIPYPLTGLSPELEEAVAAFAHEVESVGKRTLVFAGSDHDIVDVKLPDPIVFHISLYASKRASYQFGLPQFFEDLMARHDGADDTHRPKSPTPSVGFCGYAPPLGLKWGVPKLKESARLLLNQAGVMKRWPSRSAHSYRARAMRSLMRQSRVKTDFVIREQFAFAGTYGQLCPGGTPERASSFRKEYVQNLLRNDYNLCVRGIANCSIRLYETLCCGRVPVLVDTDCVLPHDSIVDWKKHVVWVQEDQIERTPELIWRFHETLSNDEFVALQASNRKLWEEHFSPEGFFRNIWRYLEVE